MRIQFFSGGSFHMTNGRSETASGGNPEITRFARLKTTIYIFFWNGNIPHLHLLHYICKITIATPVGKTRENGGKQRQFRVYVLVYVPEPTKPGKCQYFTCVLVVQILPNKLQCFFLKRQAYTYVKFNLIHDISIGALFSVRARYNSWILHLLY